MNHQALCFLGGYLYLFTHRIDPFSQYVKLLIKGYIAEITMQNHDSATSPNPSADLLTQAIQDLQATPQEYLPSLVAIIRLFRESVTLKSAEDSFRQGWQEAMTGNTIPLAELWDGIDAE